MVLLLVMLCTATADPLRPVERRVDLYGDPLPEGAVARLGTLRYRAGGRYGRLAFLADGRTLLAAEGNRLTWLDVTTGRVVRSVELGPASATLLAVTRDRSTAAVATYRYLEQEQDGEHQIVLFDTATGNERTRLPAQTISRQRPAKSADFTPDGARLATGDDAGVIRVWNLATRQQELLRALPNARQIRRDINDWVRRVALSSDGKWLLAASNQQVFRWLWQRDARMEEIGPSRRIATLELTPNSGVFARSGPPSFGGGNRSTTIRLFDVETGGELLELSGEARTLSFNHQLAFTSDGSRLVAPHTSPGGLEVYNAHTGELERTLTWESLGLRMPAHKAVVSPDDRWVAAWGGGPIAVWDLETGERVSPDDVGHAHSLESLVMSPDGRHVLTAGSEGLAIVWERESGRSVHVWRNPRGPQTPVDGIGFSGAVFSPDGKWIATSTQAELVLRDRRSGEAVHTWPGHQTPDPSTLEFTPHSRRLLSFGGDWFLRAFDVRTGQQVFERAIRPTGVPLKETPDGGLQPDVQPEIIHYGNVVGFYAPSPMRGAQLTPDARTLVLLSTHRLHVFDVETGRERAHREVGRKSRRLLKRIADEDDDAEWVDEQAAQLNRYLAVAPDSRRVATLALRAATERSREYELQVRRLDDGKQVASFPLDSESQGLYLPPLSGLQFSPDGTKIAVAARLAGARAPIDVYDIATGRREARIERAGYWLAYTPDRLTFTPDGKHIAAPQTDTTVLLWDWKRFATPPEEQSDSGQ